MSLLDDLDIRYKSLDDDLWINLSDLTNHLLESAHRLANDVAHESRIRPLQIPEAMLLRGLAEGMMSVVTLLTQGSLEAEFHEKINTVEDLLKVLDQKNGT
jgi:aspartate/glutamate racemase